MGGSKQRIGIAHTASLTQRCIKVGGPMELSGGNLILLCLGALTLSIIALLIDRINFTQRPFRPRKITTAERPQRDRTGAHIVYVDSVDEAEQRLQ